MSISMHRAMGWGMTWEDFSSHTLFEASNRNDLGEELYQCFNRVTDLTVPPEYRSVFEKNLLTRTFTNFGRSPPEMGDATHLVFNVGYDSTTHVGFLPHLLGDWHRRHDLMDGYFEAYRHGSEAVLAEEFVRFVPHGFYPWTHDMMELDGTPVVGDYHPNPNHVPAIPDQIRWYLTHLGVLTTDGINKLRPMIAQWHS